MDDKWFWALLLVGAGLVVGIAVARTLPLQAQANCGATCPLKGQTILQNEQTYTWIDYQGKERKITVHRKVKLGE